MKSRGAASAQERRDYQTATTTEEQATEKAELPTIECDCRSDRSWYDGDPVTRKTMMNLPCPTLQLS